MVKLDFKKRELNNNIVKINSTVDCTKSFRCLFYTKYVLF